MMSECERASTHLKIYSWMGSGCVEVGGVYFKVSMTTRGSKVSGHGTVRWFDIRRFQRHLSSSSQTTTRFGETVHGCFLDTSRLQSQPTTPPSQDLKCYFPRTRRCDYEHYQKAKICGRYLKRGASQADRLSSGCDLTGVLITQNGD